VRLYKHICVDIYKHICTYLGKVGVDSQVKHEEIKVVRSDPDSCDVDPS